MSTNIEPKQWCGTTPSKEVIERAKGIKLLLMDVDGVLTDGKVYYLPGNENTKGKPYETKGFDSHDGLAFHFLWDAQIDTGFISGRQSPAVDERAKNMRVKYVHQGNLQKEGIYEDILKQSALPEAEIAYIGDDFTDLSIMKRVGLACAVANARMEVKACAHFVTEADGGNGALREVVELILKAQNKWQMILQKYGLSAGCAS